MPPVKRPREDLWSEAGSNTGQDSDALSCAQILSPKRAPPRSVQSEPGFFARLVPYSVLGWISGALRWAGWAGPYAAPSSPAVPPVDAPDTNLTPEELVLRDRIDSWNARHADLEHRMEVSATEMKCTLRNLATLLRSVYKQIPSRIRPAIAAPDAIVNAARACSSVSVEDLVTVGRLRADVKAAKAQIERLSKMAQKANETAASLRDQLDGLAYQRLMRSLKEDLAAHELLGSTAVDAVAEMVDELGEEVERTRDVNAALARPLAGELAEDEEAHALLQQL